MEQLVSDIGRSTELFMAEQTKRKGIARLLEGKERYTENARAHEAGRFSLFWAVFKGRFGKMVLINLIMLICSLPVIAIVVYRNLAFAAQESLGPYGAGLMTGYPVVPDVIGYAERNILFNDYIFFSLLIPASAIAAIGLSGGMSLMRNLIRTEGIYYFSDFGRGIKRCYLSVLEGALIFTLILYLAQVSGNISNLLTATNDEKAGLMLASKIIGYILMSLMLLVCLWIASVGVSYKLGPLARFRCAFVMTFRTFPLTVAFAALAIAPIFLLLFTSGFLLILGIIFYMIFGFSYGMLVWMSFSQWAFDRYFDGIGASQEEKTAKKAAESVAQEAPKLDYRRLVVAQGRTILFGRPVKPLDEGADLYELPEEFSREDLAQLAESKAKIADEVQAYEDEHKNEEQYVEFSRQFEERDKALEQNGKKKTPKKPPKMLNKRR